MATKVWIFVCYHLIQANFQVVSSNTHWVVTEDGRIQAQMDSIYSLRRPYDLVALLKQEERSVVLDNLKQELLVRREEIDRNEDKETGLEQKFYRSDEDCLSAGKPLPEFDLYISTVLPLENKGIRPEEHINFSAPPAATPISPDCTTTADLAYSMHAFEHLEGMKDRANLTGSPELGLKNAITHRDNVDDYGHLVYEALQQNKTSWVLYNMAAFYWRIKGHPQNVVECLRRALHFCPRHQKDVALISLANILHKARYSNEAAIVVHAALDVSKELNVNHFTLGNIYAVLAEYNKSVICFENTLRIQPDFEAAAKRKHAVLCHSKLEAALEAQHRSLQRTLTELRDYQEKHEFWQRQQEKSLREQVSPEVNMAQRVSYEAYKIRLMAAGVGEYCRMEDKDGRQVLQCFWGKRNAIMNDYDFVTRPPNDKEEDGSELQDDDYAQVANSHYQTPTQPLRYPERAAEPEEHRSHQAEDWPSKDECDTYVKKFPQWNEFMTTYLPPENKGYVVEALLSEAQGLQSGQEHELPWYPPTCVSIESIPEGTQAGDDIPAVRDRKQIVQKTPDLSMREVLLRLVEDQAATEEEVGQRILTALKKGVGPRWVLYTLAALYWRVVGNNYHGVECCRRALHHVPAALRDVPLLSLANILYRVGRVDDALTAAREAVLTNPLEPESQFFLGNMLAAKGNMSGSIHHYEEALHQAGEHANVLSALRIIKCYQKFHRTAQSAAPKEPPSTCNTQGSTGACKGRENGKVESRVICKTENGKENCIVETASTTCAGSQCRQTCSVAPLRLEACSGVGGVGCGDGCLDAAACNKKVAEGELCGQVGADTLQSISSGYLDPSFHTKLDEISEHLRQKGLCPGDDCQRFLVQCITPIKTELGTVHTLAQRQVVFRQPLPHAHCANQNQEAVPYTRLEVIQGVLHEKLIFTESVADIAVTASDCIIYSDGRKSAGCEREEFKPFEIELYISKVLSQSELDLLPQSAKLQEQLKKYASINMPSPDTLDKKPPPTEDSDSNPEEEAEEEDCDLEMYNVATRDSTPDSDTATSPLTSQASPDKEEKMGKATGAVPVQEVLLSNDMDETVERVWDNFQTGPPSSDQDGFEGWSDDYIVAFQPDPARHVHQMAELPAPSPSDCRQQRPVNFLQFMSTWISVTTKQINLREHVDFIGFVHGQNMAPECSATSIVPTLPLDALEAVVAIKRLDYTAESGLRDALQTLGGLEESVEEAGTRIALALKQNTTSWVLANLAVLYWRVLGDAPRALDCIRVAYKYSPRNARDIALLSLANVLHSSGALGDALTAANMALEAAPSLVATQFTTANVYAAQQDWPRAALFYRAVLGIQASFLPAQQRLHTIMCRDVLAPDRNGNPKHKTKKTKRKNS